MEFGLVFEADAGGIGELEAAALDHGIVGEPYGDVSKELHLFRRHGLETESARTTSNCQHTEIVDALAAGDSAAASQLMEAHIRSGKERMLAAIHD